MLAVPALRVEPGVIVSESDLAWRGLFPLLACMLIEPLHL